MPRFHASFLRLPFAVCVLAFALCALIFQSSPVQANSRANPTLWSGIYVGGHAGVGETDFDSLLDGSEIPSFTPDDAVMGNAFDLDSGLGGIQAGINRTFSDFLLGLEADLTYFGRKERRFDPNDFGLGNTDNATVEIDWLASLRARAGIVSANTLFFATAGLAWIDARYTAQNASNSPFDQGSISLGELGFVAGGGLEHALTPRLRLRLEALYYGFDDLTDTSGLTTDSDPGDFAEIRDILVARMALSYMLSGREDERRTSRPPAIFSGVYAGGHIGYAHTDFDGVFDVSEFTRGIDIEDSVFGEFFDLDGFAGGLHAGVNIERGRYVFGVEADWTSFDKSDRVYDPDLEFPGTDNATVDIDWLASLRGRLGVRSARTLIYGTAGLAWIDANYTAEDADFFIVDRGTVDISADGFVVGGGLEHAKTDNLLIRAEGLYYDFNDRIDTRSLNIDSDLGDFAKIEDVLLFRIGLSYKFGGQRMSARGVN